MMIAFNQLVNAISGGDPQESISSRFGHAREHGSRFAKAACAVMEAIDVHHPNPLYPPTADHCDIALIDHYNRLEAGLAK